MEEPWPAEAWMQKRKAWAGHNVLRYCEGGTTVYRVLILSVNLISHRGL